MPTHEILPYKPLHLVSGHSLYSHHKLCQGQPKSAMRITSNPLRPDSTLLHTRSPHRSAYSRMVVYAYVPYGTTASQLAVWNSITVATWVGIVAALGWQPWAGRCFHWWPPPKRRQLLPYRMQHPRRVCSNSMRRGVLRPASAPVSAATGWYIAPAFEHAPLPSLWM